MLQNHSHNCLLVRISTKLNSDVLPTNGVKHICLTKRYIPIQLVANQILKSRFALSLIEPEMARNGCILVCMRVADMPVWVCILSIVEISVNIPRYVIEVVEQLRADLCVCACVCVGVRGWKYSNSRNAIIYSVYKPQFCGLN